MHKSSNRPKPSSLPTNAPYMVHEKGAVVANKEIYNKDTWSARLWLLCLDTMMLYACFGCVILFTTLDKNGWDN